MGGECAPLALKRPPWAAARKSASVYTRSAAVGAPPVGPTAPWMAGDGGGGMMAVAVARCGGEGRWVGREVKMGLGFDGGTSWLEP